jgi:hypothetical protein
MISWYQQANRCELFWSFHGRSIEAFCSGGEWPSGGGVPAEVLDGVRGRGCTRIKADGMGSMCSRCKHTHTHRNGPGENGTGLHLRPVLCNLWLHLNPVLCNPWRRHAEDIEKHFTPQSTVHEQRRLKMLRPLVPAGLRPQTKKCQPSRRAQEARLRGPSMLSHMRSWKPLSVATQATRSLAG